MAHEISFSNINTHDVVHQGEVNGRWVMEIREWPGIYPAGTLVCDPADPDDPWIAEADDDAQYDSATFTAPNGKRYYSVASHNQFTPREEQ
jgi:hypothetical protein